MTQPVLRTERLTLRPFSAADIAPLHTFFSDPDATRFWSDTHKTIDETRAFVEGTIAADPATTCDFVIERNGEAIGKAGMWQAPEIGFFVLPAHQRQGIAREALVAVIPHLFSAYDMGELTADVDPDNAASIGLLKSLGFRETHRAERTLQIRGQWCDSVYFALGRDEARFP